MTAEEAALTVARHLGSEGIAAVLETRERYEQRMTAEGEAQKKEVIKISEYWTEQLASMPYLSCKSSSLSIGCNHIFVL